MGGVTAVEERPQVAELTDLQLVELTQSGSRDAVGELWLRHYPSTLRTASGVTRQPGDAEEVTSEAFTAMMSACLNGHGPTTSVRAYLSTSVRNLAAKRATGPRSAELPSDDPTRYEDADRLEPDVVARRAELGLVREAFSSLPDRWQTVLWRTAVDHDSHDRVAEAMGLSRNGVAALAVRARRALKVAYLQAHVSRGTVDVDCRPFLDQLANLSQGGRPGRELQQHLDGCDRCPERLRELAMVEQNVAGFMLPAVAILIPTTQHVATAGGIVAATAAGHGAAAVAAGHGAAAAGHGTTTGASGAIGGGLTSGSGAGSGGGASGGAGSAGAASGGSRAESLSHTRHARQIRQAAVVGTIAVVAAATAFALTRSDPAPAAFDVVATDQPSSAVTDTPPTLPVVPSPLPVPPEATVLPDGSPVAGGATGGAAEGSVTGGAAGGTTTGGATGVTGGSTTGATGATGGTTTAPTAQPTTPTPTTPGAPSNPTPTPTPTPSVTPTTPVVPQVYAPATVGIGMSGSGTAVTIRPSATTGAPTTNLRLRLTVPAGVTLTGSTGAWTGCTQSGTIITCLTATTAASSFTGTVNTTWPSGTTGTCLAAVSGTTTGGASLSASLGIAWPLVG